MERIELVWRGPFIEDDLKNLSKEGNEPLKGKGVYQIYGSHPVTGANTLLYIGQSQGEKTSIGKRIKGEIENDEHIWYYNTGGKVEFYVAEACLGERGKCSHENECETEDYNDLNCHYFVQSQINKVEKLLIIAHMPPCNSQNLSVNYSNQTEEEHYLIYNRDFFNRLLPSISSEYYELTVDEE